MLETERGFADAIQVVADSATVRWATRAVAAVEHAVVSSAFAAIVRRFRVTHIGVIVMSLCVTHAVLLQLLPDRVAPVKPLAYGMIVAFAAFVVVAGFITTRSSATAIAESSAGTANTMKS